MDFIAIVRDGALAIAVNSEKEPYSPQLCYDFQFMNKCSFWQAYVDQVLQGKILSMYMENTECCWILLCSLLSYS